MTLNKIYAIIKHTREGNKLFEGRHKMFTVRVTFVEENLFHDFVFDDLDTARKFYAYEMSHIIVKETIAITTNF